MKATYAGRGAALHNVYITRARPLVFFQDERRLPLEWVTTVRGEIEVEPDDPEDGILEFSTDQMTFLGRSYLSGGIVTVGGKMIRYFSAQGEIELSGRPG